MAMTSHQLANRLLELQDYVLLTSDEDFVSGASESTYATDDPDALELPCIIIETE